MTTTERAQFLTLVDAALCLCNDDSIPIKIRAELSEKILRIHDMKITPSEEWIDVHPQPLPESGRYLTYDSHSKAVLVNFIAYGLWSQNNSTVTHWRALPKGPTI